MTLDSIILGTAVSVEDVADAVSAELSPAIATIDTVVDGLAVSLATVDTVVDGIALDYQQRGQSVTLPAGVATEAKQDTSKAVIDGIALDYQQRGVSVTLPAGVATTAKQDTAKAVIDGIALDYQQRGQAVTLPSGVATEAKQDTLAVNLATVDTVVDGLAVSVATVDGVVDGIAADYQQRGVSVTLPSGVATTAKQDAIKLVVDEINTNLDTVDTVVDGIAVNTTELDTLAELCEELTDDLATMNVSVQYIRTKLNLIPDLPSTLTVSPEDYNIELVRGDDYVYDPITITSTTWHTLVGAVVVMTVRNHDNTTAFTTTGTATTGSTQSIIFSPTHTDTNNCLVGSGNFDCQATWTSGDTTIIKTLVRGQATILEDYSE